MAVRSSRDSLTIISYQKAFVKRISKLFSKILKAVWRRRCRYAASALLTRQLSYLIIFCRKSQPFFPTFSYFLTVFLYIRHTVPYFCFRRHILFAPRHAKTLEFGAAICYNRKKQPSPRAEEGKTDARRPNEAAAEEKLCSNFYASPAP